MDKTLHVGNLPPDVRDTDLAVLFEAYGIVLRAQVVLDRDTNRGKGFGFVEMDTEASARAAQKGLDDSECQGNRLTVQEAKPRPPLRWGSGYGERAKSAGPGSRGRGGTPRGGRP